VVTAAGSKSTQETKSEEKIEIADKSALYS